MNDITLELRSHVIWGPTNKLSRIQLVVPHTHVVFVLYVISAWDWGAAEGAGAVPHSAGGQEGPGLHRRVLPNRLRVRVPGIISRREGAGGGRQEVSVAQPWGPL